MTPYETSATVQAQGQVHVAGVPFAPGTEVEVIIKPVENGTGTAATDRVGRLLAALDKGRNIEPLDAFNRGELYDRDVLR